MPLSPLIQSVLHPSDLSGASHSAFAHALAIVLYRQASLTVLHVVPEHGALDVWSDAPKVRKTLDSTTAADIASIDFEAWRTELQVMAAALALDRCNGDLRTALTALVGAIAARERDAEATSCDEIPELADITALVAGSPVACRLLERVVLRWCDDIAGAD